jgi:hypothetical protein
VEVLALSLSWMTVEEWMAARLVNTKWFSAVGYLHELELGTQTRCSDAWKPRWVGSASSRRLLLSSCPSMSSEVLNSIREVDFSDSPRVAVRELRLFASNLILVQKISCPTSITDEGLWALTSLPTLTEFVLRDCNRITDLGVRKVTNLKGLTILDLSGCSQLTDSAAQEIAKLPNLSSLSLRGCLRITAVGFAEIAKLGG